MSQQHLRILIVVKWLFVVVLIVVSLATERFLPPELRAYLEASEEVSPTFGEWLLLAVSVAWLLFDIVISVGLYRFRKWAKNLLLPCCAIGFLLLPLYGPVVESGWTNTLNHLGSIVNGAILALVYLSPLSDVFEPGRKPISPAQSLTLSAIPPESHSGESH